MNLEQILGNSDLFDEIVAQVETAGARAADESADAAAKLKEMPGSWSAESAARDHVLEAIVREHGRPVLFIQKGVIQEPKLEFWKTRLAPARDGLQTRIPSVGRVELENHPDLPWAGTGWLVAPDVAVTNRHVAVEFGRRDGDGFVFRENPARRRIRARIDTLEEHGSGAERQYRVREILHIEDDDGRSPDIAFLKVSPESQDGDELPDPIPLAASDPSANQVIGAVGYAAWDGRRNPGEAMPRIFQNIYNVKRLHPGEVMVSAEGSPVFTHDCSTLGGNSGSTIIDFATGEAVGLHFAGSFLDQNWAVKASVVRARLRDVLGISV